MYRSTSSRGHVASWTGGALTARSGCQAQCSLRSVAYFAWYLPSDAGNSTCGQAAPSLIHWARSAISAADSCCPSSGIFTFWWVCRTAWIKRLLSGCPGTTAGPLPPPTIRPLRSSTRSPPLELVSAEWQL